MHSLSLLHPRRHPHPLQIPEIFSSKRPKSISEIRPEPYALPEGFEWATCDVMDDAVLTEVYSLLAQNYVEDDDSMFRFNYPAQFLRWALTPPGFIVDWLIGVRVKATGRLVGFISGIPAQIRAGGTEMPMAEINFLCVHKKLRSKRLAPLLIREVTRRVNLRDIWQAAYTAGVVIPKPVSIARYYHRSLNPKKLIEIGFSRMPPRMTMARLLKLNKLADEPQTPGFRALRAEDVPACHRLLERYLKRFALAPHFDEQELAHWLVPRDGIVSAFVVERGGAVTDFVSFYCLPSTVLGHEVHTELKAAYQLYTVPSETPLLDLMRDGLIAARNEGFDVFNCLDIMENKEFIEELKFGMGDGNLQYYLYNYRMMPRKGQADKPAPLEPGDVGLILM